MTRLVMWAPAALGALLGVAGAASAAETRLAMQTAAPFPGTPAAPPATEGDLLLAAELGGGEGARVFDAPPDFLLEPEVPLIVEPPALFSTDDLLLMEVNSGAYQLTDSLAVYSSRGGVFLPLGALARLLDFAVTTDVARGVADGWVIAQRRTFRLDLSSGIAGWDGRSVRFSRAQAAVADGDIYVRADLVEQILPLRIKAQLNDLVLSVTPTETLPFQARMAREAAHKNLDGRGEEEAVLRVRTPYELFTPPAVDVNLTLAGGNRAPKAVGRYEVRAAGDLAYAGLEVFAGSDDKGRLDDMRVLLERKDPYGRDAGLRGLTRISIGDTFTPNLAVGPASLGGRGIAFTTAPLEQASVFGTTDLRGELPQDWDVELYLNEVLQGARSEPVNGLYEFKAVRLAYGVNTVRLVFYGPRGERREEVRRVNVGAALAPKGKALFTFGAVQQGTPVFDFGRHATGEDRDARVMLPGDGRWRFTAEAAYGLSQMTTITAGAARYAPISGGERTMGSVGVATSALGLAGQLTAAGDDAGGSAVSLGLAGRPLGVSTVLRHTEYAGGFVDEAQAIGVGVRRNTNVTLDYTARLGSAGFLPVSFRATRDEFVFGGSRLTAAAQVSKPIGSYLVSSSIAYQGSRIGDGDASNQLTGAFDVSALVMSRWQLRAGAAYTLSPGAKLDSVFATADRNISDRTALRFAVGHSFGEDSSTTLQAAGTWRLSFADVSLVTAYATHDREFRVGLNLSAGFGYDPSRRRYRMVGPGAAAGGALQLRAFVDADADGVRDPGEEAVPGIRIYGGRRPDVTDQLGDAEIIGLGNGAIARVRADTDGVEDPYLAPPPRVIEIVPRPGRMAVVPYPMTATGEVELKAVIRRPDEGVRGLSALSLQLVDARGAVVAEGRTEYDGTLLVEGVRPGVYSVRIEEGQAERLRMSLARPSTVVVGAAGGFVGQVIAEVSVAAMAEH